ncbi:MAG: alpha/beta hydrolase [Deltaproteobacteria bacterium]|nr:MAG: alpha/beta hydrolase [Deltaproteobacteria bacterium]
MVMNDFNPPPYLRNGHVQSLLASAGPRKFIARRLAKKVLTTAEEHIFTTSEGSKLLSYYTQNPNQTRGLVTLIHGWEGSSSSSYILSAAAHLYECGFSILRLNMRDHGPSHHLNRELFHSCRLDEVGESVAMAGELFGGGGKCFLAGFSLGGNFALRIAASEWGEGLAHVVAVSPVVDPNRAMKSMNEGPVIYSAYFVHKWKRSLRKKASLYPDLNLEGGLSGRTLDELNAYFAPQHTPFPDAPTYFNAYAVTGSALSKLRTGCTIIMSEDDPVLPTDDLERMDKNEKIQIIRTRHGGHCGFISSIKLNSWVDERLEELFS